MSITDIGFCISLVIGIFVVVIIATCLICFMIREGLFRVTKETDPDYCNHNHKNGTSAIEIDKELSNGALQCKCMICGTKFVVVNANDFMDTHKEEKVEEYGDRC